MRIILTVILLLLMVCSPVLAQTPEPTPIRVEAAVTGELTAENPNALYSFQVLESQRMGFVFDTQGDMNVTLVVYDQDGTTVLGGSTGTNNNGVIVTFPTTGQYFLSLTGEGGTQASYRLMIDADPALPLNTFVMQSYLVSGTSANCAENIPAAYFSPAEDLNVCFTLALVESPTELTVQWWSPTGEILAESTTTFTADYNMIPYLTGIINNGTPFETTWWQVHFLINGELAHIQWVWVQE